MPLWAVVVSVCRCICAHTHSHIIHTHTDTLTQSHILSHSHNSHSHTQLKHTLSHVHTHTTLTQHIHSQSHTHCHTQSLTHTLIHTHTLTHNSHSHPHTVTHTLAHIHSHSLSLTHIYSLSHIYTLTHTHCHTPSHTYTRAASLCLRRPCRQLPLHCPPLLFFVGTGVPLSREGDGKGHTALGPGSTPQLWLASLGWRRPSLRAPGATGREHGRASLAQETQGHPRRSCNPFYLEGSAAQKGVKGWGHSPMWVSQHPLPVTLNKPVPAAASQSLKHYYSVQSPGANST